MDALESARVGWAKFLPESTGWSEALLGDKSRTGDLLSETIPSPASGPVWTWPDETPFGLIRLFLVVVLAYAAGSQTAMLLNDISGLDSVFFIPAGITVAFLLRLAKRFWWVVIAAAGLTELAMDLISGFGMEISLGFALANTLEPLAGALIVSGLRAPLDLARVRHVWRFILGAIVIGPAIGAAIGAVSNRMLGGDDLVNTFWQWWLGDALSVILVGSAILVWGSSPDRRRLVSPWGIGLVVATGLLTIGVHLTPLPLTFLVLIVIVIAGAMFGVRAVAMIALLVTVLIALDLSLGAGEPIIGLSEALTLVVIKLQLAVFTIAGLIVGAEAHEREVATKTAVIATSRARLSEEERRLERQIAVRLQEELLRGRSLEHPQVSIAARYEAGSDALLVGGDWYDVFDLPDGKVGLTVGDVVGHGLEATASMGRLRTAMTALAPHTESPGRLLSDLDRFAHAYSENPYATAAYALLDPGTGLLRYASAGHPPMLVVEPDGTTRWLVEGRSSPLVEDVISHRPEASTTLSPGALLIGYTDGLIERRGESLQTGLDRLEAAAATMHRQSEEEICDLLFERLGVGVKRNDDIAVVVLRYAPSPVPAGPTS